jgi:solute carrier family 50 (sugar transporter)
MVRWSGYLAPISSILLCCSPIPTIQHIIHDEKVGHYPLLPYTIMCINTLLWLTYGILRHELALYCTNGISLLLAIYYWLRYVQYTPFTTSTVLYTILPGTVRQHMIALIVAILIAMIFAISILLVFNNSNNATTTTTLIQWLGGLAMLSGIVLYASPLTSIHYVMTTKCSRSIPLPFTMTSLWSCSLWTIYGLYQTNDWNVYLPGMIGGILALTQLLLKIYYGDNCFTELQDDIDVLLIHPYPQHDPEKRPIMLESDVRLPITTYHSLI